MEFDNTNRGVLFHENAKESEKHPDYTGTINVGGTEYRLAGWKKIGKSSQPFLSLSVSEKKSGYDNFKEQGQRLQSKQDNLPTNEEVDEPIDLSEIPF